MLNACAYGDCKMSLCACTLCMRVRTHLSLVLAIERLWRHLRVRLLPLGIVDRIDRCATRAQSAQCGSSPSRSRIVFIPGPEPVVRCVRATAIALSHTSRSLIMCKAYARATGAGK